MTRRNWTWRSDTASPPVAHAVVLLPLTHATTAMTVAERCVDRPSVCGLLTTWTHMTAGQAVCTTCANERDQFRDP